MRRPLTVVQLLPALDAGGAERSTVEIAAALAAAGHRAIVVSAGGRLLPELLAAGGEHVELAIGRKSPLTLRHARTLRGLLRATGADIVHARSRLPAWVAVAALRGLPAAPALVTTVHGLNSPGRYSAVMLRGQRIICVSECVRAFVRTHYPQVDPARLQVIPRGVDAAAFAGAAPLDAAWIQALRAQHPALEGGRLLLLPARGTRLKGHRSALDLLQALRREGVDARLLLAGVVQPGRAAYVEALRAQARRLGVHTAVAFSEPLARRREMYAMADLVLQLSERPEAFGRTVTEALASGRAVLGWDHGGVGELLRELFAAGAVAPGDMAGLVRRAGELLASPAPALRLPDRYTLARMQADTLALYADLAARAG